MPFISFIYRVGKSKKTYYGKYCSDYISDDHEGLDTEVKYSLLKGLKKYNEEKNQAKNEANNEENKEEKIEKPKKDIKVTVGVLSFSSSKHIPTYSSENEMKCFDFYHDYDAKIYINGKKIE
jgi:hypothetical protein